MDNRTEADGLAVGRPSYFATEISRHLISGIFTLEDEPLFSLLSRLQDSEQLFVEPSATAGLIGPQRMQLSQYAQQKQIPLAHATHIAWSTGGALVPEKERKAFYTRGQRPFTTLEPQK